MMKKFTLLMITFLFSFSLAHAQSYSLSWDGNEIGEDVMLLGDPADFELVFHAILTNNSDDTDTIKVRRTFVQMVDGALHYLCWGLCYAPNSENVFVSPAYIVLGPGESCGEEDFAGHYEINGAIGTSIVEYTFFNQSDEDENITVTVTYKASPENVAEQIMANGFISEIYPNPATSSVSLDYELTSDVETASLRIVNLLGEVVKDAGLNRNATNHKLIISDLESGVYFYSVIINNKVYKTKKLIVR
jgi:hypothetical protein